MLPESAKSERLRNGLKQAGRVVLSLLGIALLFPGACSALCTPLLLIVPSAAFSSHDEFGGGWLWLGGLVAGALGIWILNRIQSGWFSN